MYIFELTKPGNWLESEDKEWSWKIERLLDHLEFAFYEANVALNLFMQQQNNQIEQQGVLQLQWEKEMQERRTIETLVREELGLSPFENPENIQFEVDARFKREKWSSGEIPRSHKHCVIFIYAKSFLYSLDTIDKFIKVISNEPYAPESIKALHDQIGKDFPDLRGVRNSTQHLEDRARGLGAGREPKPLNLQPISNTFINAPQGALILNNLNGTKFGSTMSDGHYGEVDISPESLSKMQSIVQGVLDSFKWVGNQQHLPS